MEVCGVVIDNGSGFIKAGLAGDDTPSLIFPSVVATAECSEETEEQVELWVGEEALSKKGGVRLGHPIEKCVVTDWEGTEAMWRHVFNKLGVDPEEQPTMVTEAPLTTKANREKMTEVLFERFKVPAMYVALAPVLSLYSSGRTTGFVVDVGHGGCSTVPIYEGYALPHAISSLPLPPGPSLTSFLLQLLSQKAAPLSPSVDYDVCNSIKEQLCYVALDPKEEELKNDLESCYKLPDGEEVVVGPERFQCPEALFDPSLVGVVSPGIHHIVYDTVVKVDRDIKQELFRNVILSGGTSMLPGLAERLQKELTNLAPPNFPIKVLKPPERRYSTWIGGSILASLSTFQKMWISSYEYEESGPSIVHRKC